MLSRTWMRNGWAIFALVTTVAIAGSSVARGTAQQLAIAGQEHAATATRWETETRKHRIPPLTKVRGSLAIDDKGVEFQSGNGRNQRWAFADIRTAFIAPHRLVLETYVNRTLHRPGEQRYEFDLTEAVPPPVAAALAASIARPLQNAVTDAAAPAIATIPVHHRTLTGGTNGVLRFRTGGIDYVTSSKEDSRSWTWADLQTLSDPDPYHLFVFGFRDTYTFDLKAPITRALFDRATDEIRAHAADAPVYAPGISTRPDSQGAEMREK